MRRPLLIFPGIGNSGPGHWQSLWQPAYPQVHRIDLADWESAERAVWVTALDRQLATLGPESVIVAHSLACLAVAHWAADAPRPIAGAFLVTVPDPAGPSFPVSATGFSPVPMRPLPFASLMVASGNDPYSSLGHARACAAAWGSRLVAVGDQGHINTASGHGDWPEGRALLDGFLSELPV